MFTQTWKKYLPVITILLKRSVNGDQALSMNHTDFERAAGGRKIKFSFSSLRLTKGRTDIAAKHSVLASDLVQMLLESEETRQLIRSGDFEFAMNRDFQLIIKNKTEAQSPIAEELPADAGK